MKRRDFIALVGTAVITAPRAGMAQTPTKVYRLALVNPGGPLPESAPYAKLLLGGLAQLGYVLGQNLAFEGPHGAAGQAVQLPHLMDELKASKVVSSWSLAIRRQSRPRRLVFPRLWRLAW